MKWLLVLVLFAACNSIKYSDDFGFLNSAQANSPEHPFMINGVICKDTDGIQGLCAKRIKSDSTLVISLMEKPYAYKVAMQCTKETGIDQSFSVPSNSKFELKVAPEQYQLLRSFTCIGEVFPSEGNESFSSKFEVRVKVIDSKYVARESMQIIEKNNKKYLILGEHARYSYFFDGHEWKTFSKKTAVEVKDVADTRAFSESATQRWNSYGI